MFRAIAHKLNLFGYSVRAVGAGRMLSSSLRWASDGEARTVDSGFDATYGTDTNADLTPGEARIPRERRRAATMYLPTMDQDLEAIFEAIAWPASLLEQASFVDLGSGKGRAVFLAAMRRFREVIGVELSPVLHDVAESNLAIMREANVLASPVRLVHGDATAYDVPDGPVLTYLYHPFREPIAAQVMERLEASIEACPRPAAVLYCHPTLQNPLDTDVFERGGVFHPHAEGGRETRHFRIGWTVWTNHAWLGARP